QITFLRLCGNRLWHAVSRKDHGRIGVRNLVELLYENGALGLETLDHIPIVHDLVTYVDRRAVASQRLLDRIDGPHHSGAKAARRAQEHSQRRFVVVGSRHSDLARTRPTRHGPVACVCQAKAYALRSCAIRRPTTSRTGYTIPPCAGHRRNGRPALARDRRL